jgi:hypothetical protein
MKKAVTMLLTICLCLCLCLCAYASEETTESYGYGYINRNGEVAIEPQFDYAYNFSSGRGRVFSGSISSYGGPDEGLYGYIDETGSIVIPVIYEEASDFTEEGLAVVCKNGKYGVINTAGETVIDFSYDYITALKNTGTFRAFTGTLNSYGSPDSGTTYVLKADGTQIFSGTFDYFYGCKWYYEAEKDDKYALFALDGTQLTMYSYDWFTAETENIIGFKKGDYYGYMDAHGNVLIEAQYDSIGSFVDGKAIVEKNGRYFLIDETGKTLVTYKADYMSNSIVNGFTYAFEGTLTSYDYPETGAYYLMSIDGNYVSRGYTKGDCYNVSQNGTWRVKEGGNWYVVDMSGKELLSVTCEDFYTCGDDRNVVKKNGYYALMDSDGNLLTDYSWDRMGSGTTSELIAVYRASNDPDFRSVRWGMTEDEVKATENGTVTYSGKVNGTSAWYIGYDTTLMGNDVILAYYFGANGLYQARYIWKETHSNENLYISDYNDVKAQLTKKYGSPWYDKENWDTSSHKSYYSEKKGDALSYGYLTYETDYSTLRSYITMSMSADNYQVSFVIYYESKDVTAPDEDYSSEF